MTRHDYSTFTGICAAVLMALIILLYGCEQKCLRYDVVQTTCSECDMQGWALYGMDSPMAWACLSSHEEPCTSQVCVEYEVPRKKLD